MFALARAATRSVISNWENGYREPAVTARSKPLYQAEHGVEVQFAHEGVMAYAQRKSHRGAVSFGKAATFASRYLEGPRAQVYPELPSTLHAGSGDPRPTRRRAIGAPGCVVKKRW